MRDVLGEFVDIAGFDDIGTLDIVDLGMVGLVDIEEIGNIGGYCNIKVVESVGEDIGREQHNNSF